MLNTAVLFTCTGGLFTSISRDVAQSGSAPEWGSGGRGFKSRRPDWSNAKHRWRLRRRCFVLQEAVVPFVVLFC